MMIDANIVAVSPSSVYRVLLRSGITSPPETAAHREEFPQPKRPHEQWRRDISYLNILGVHYFFIYIQDGYSHYIVHHEVSTEMTTRDVEIVTERALEKLPAECGMPRLITANESQSVLREEFQVYLRECDASHGETMVNQPQSNGESEGFHEGLKEEDNRVAAMTDLEEARRLIDGHVADYNENHLLSALQYLAPADYLKGDEHIKQRLERRKEKMKEAARIRKVSHRPETKFT